MSSTVLPAALTTAAIARPVTIGGVEFVATRIFVPRMERAQIESGLLFNNGYSYGYELLANNPNQTITFGGDSVGVGQDIQVVLDADFTGVPGPLTYEINWAGMFLRNPADLVELWSSYINELTISSGASDYGSTMTERVIVNFADNDGDQGIFAGVFPATTDRYWQITVDDGGTLGAQCSMLWVGTYFDIAVRCDYGYTETDGFNVAQIDVGGGRTLSRLGVSSPRRRIIRNYGALTGEQLAIIRGAFNAAYGSHVPVIVVDYEDSPNLEPRCGRIMRFAQENLSERRVECPEERWALQLAFEELAIIPFGRSY